MTVNNSANKVIAAGNGVQTVFNFGFIAVAASDLAVILTDSSGNETTLLPANYTVALNPVPPGQIWSIGGTVTYPLVGSPIPTGSTLTIVRELSLTQLVALGNQGNEFPSAVETALDLLEMQLQQVNETFQRAIVAPVVDPAAPLPLPPVAQRANMGMAFDGNGNPIAAALPASGVISSAMQPVVDAATLALGRTAFGLGTMATEGIGAGLQDDGSGNARVLFPILEVATNQAVHAAAHTTQYMATGSLTFTLDRANTLFDGFQIKVFALTAALTFAIDANDKFVGQSSGASLIIPKGCVAILTTNAQAAGTWFADVAGVSPVLNTVILSGSGNYTPDASVLAFDVLLIGGGSGGGGSNSSVASTSGNPTTFSGSGATLNAGGGQGSSATLVGAGGSASGGNVFNIAGNSGGGGSGSATGINGVGGSGGPSILGGAPAGGINTTGHAAPAGSGAGGGGGGAAASTPTISGPGGASGGAVRHVVNSPSGAYAYSVGVGGAGAASGGTGGAGAAGGSGTGIIVEYRAFAA